MSDGNNDTEVVEQPSYLEMSDEDVLKAGPPVITEASANEETAGQEHEEGSTPVNKGAVDGEDKDDLNEEAGVSKASESGESNEQGEGDDSGDEPDTKPKPAKKEAKAEEEEKVKESVETKTVDYKAEYERVLAPFKANGKDIQVDSVDDAISLMQMGANYQKKMASLKPNLKLLKSLEHAGLLSEEKIGYLIDLSRKDPGAINRLVKESGIDPMELDAAKADAYRPKTYAVDDKEIDLDTVLDEIQDSKTYTRTLDVVTNKWDAASKQVISGQPQLLKVIDNHMASGVYDRISNEVERERMLGRLSGLSDLEAYKQVGDAINARRGFDDLFAQKGNGQGETKQPPDVIPAKPKKLKEDDKLNEKRRAASSTKPAATPADTPVEFNPLAFSDEEFSKLTLPKFK